jgi:HEAT repeat protein
MVALKDENVHVRKMAALALGDVGPLANLAVPFLREALRGDREIGVRRRAAVALGEIGDEEALKALREAAIQDKDEGVREMALLALQDQGTLKRRAA